MAMNMALVEHGTVHLEENIWIGNEKKEMKCCFTSLLTMVKSKSCPQIH